MKQINERKDELHDGVTDEVRPFRRADHEIDPAFLNRWSPRAFSSEPVNDEALMSIFEAARWAASSYNEQPWRFLIARTPEDRRRFLDFLVPANRVWSENAPVLVVLISKRTFTRNAQPNKSYQFDAGTASGYMALQAAMNNLYMHGMAGFDAEAARAALSIPEDFEPLAVYALGHRGDASALPEALRGIEQPSGRRAVSESIMEGRFRMSTEAAAERDTKIEDDGSLTGEPQGSGEQIR